LRDRCSRNSPGVPAQGDHVITYLRDVAERERRAAVLDGAQRSGGMLARVASYVEAKPGLFGATIDMKAIPHDIAKGAPNADASKPGLTPQGLRGRFRRGWSAVFGQSHPSG
jgi:hypothetical protein